MKNFSKSNMKKHVAVAMMLVGTVAGVATSSVNTWATETSSSDSSSLSESVKLNSEQLGQVTKTNGSNKLIDDPNTTVVTDDTVISSDYSFFVQFIKGKTTVETIGDSWSEKMKTPEGEQKDRSVSIPIKDVQKGKSGVIYRNVSAFGEEVDARFIIEDFKEGKTTDGKVPTDGQIAFNTRDQVGVYQNRIQEATFSIEFLKAGTNEPIHLDGFYTFSDIDWTQYITLHSDMLDKSTGILADPTCWLVLTENEDKSKTFAEVNNQGSDDYDIHAMFTVLFRDLSKFTVSFGSAHATDKLPVNNDWEWSWFGNTAVKPARSDDPNPEKTVTDIDEKEVTQNQLAQMNETFTYSITQNISGQLEQFYHRSFEMIDEIIPELERISEVKVVDESGEDRSNFFKDQSEGNKVHVVATEEALNTQDFYGHTYTFSFDTNVREAMNLDKYFNQEEKMYYFPNQAKTLINNQEKLTNQTQTKVGETPDDNPIKKIKDSNGKEVDVSQVKQGEVVEFVISNPTGVPYSSIGKPVSIYDDLEDVFMLDDKSIKMEIADLGDQVEFTDITDKGNLLIDKEAEKATWSIEDGSILAGKQYRLTISGTVKTDVDFSSYVDDSGNIRVPNIAYQIIGDEEKTTNQVNVIVPQEKPEILPPTAIDNGNNQLLVVTVLVCLVSALCLMGVFLVKGKKNERNN
ncbi:cell wall surface anchor family protein (plasmid) [Enterococcus mundtii QU 25]|uniref:isopeptide-forming domain-containing fimbrial protein n=1 Tax=Enterococcus mundtii TaxID=53346 RepID=UPI0003C5544C|nr:isopeptide-forming domain-containing fimbrial protein [Enterococcus mundtii]BAO08739.1 cell wall surface anchor family protein [Enterococcus mundtii QU 25]